MLKKFVKHYYTLFDEKLENGTIVVLIIAFLITGVGNITNTNSINDNLVIKASLTDLKANNDLLKINGKTYKLID